MRPWYRDALPSRAGGTQTSDYGHDVPSAFEWLQAMWGLVKHTFLESWHREQSTRK
jgi:hypothetical protein